MEPSAGHNQVLKSIAPGRTGRCLPGRSSVGPSLEAQRRFGELPGRPALQLGRRRGRSQLMLPSRWPVGPCPARPGRGGGGSVWDGYCVEFDFSRPAPGKLASLGTARIIYRELANQTQQSNLTFPSPRKFLQLGVARRQTNLLVVPNFPPACVASETITPYEIS